MERPVLKREELPFGPVTEWELDTSLAYVREKYGTELDRDLLRILVNTTNERRSENVVLPLLAARVVSEGVPFKNKTEKPKYEAYKGGVMKVFSERSARSPKAQAKKIASAARTRASGQKKRREHPLDARPKHKGQLVLL